MVIKVSSYDMLGLPAKKGQIYYVTDTRTMYKDHTHNKLERRIYPAIIINTDNERLNKLRPVNGVNYYVLETNCLWCFDARWVLKDGDLSAASYNTYVVDTDGISPYVSSDESITNSAGDRIIDNNGLLGNGSVVVRDPNRIQRARLECNYNAQSIDMIGFMDNGLRFYPYGSASSEDARTVGSLHLGVDLTLSDNLVDPTTSYAGSAHYYGTFNVHGDVCLVVSDLIRDKTIESIPEDNEKLWISFESTATNIIDNDVEGETLHKIKIIPKTASTATVDVIILASANADIPVVEGSQQSYEYQKHYSFDAVRSNNGERYEIPALDIGIDVAETDLPHINLDVNVTSLTDGLEIAHISDGTLSVQQYYSLNTLLQNLLDTQTELSSKVEAILESIQS